MAPKDITTNGGIAKNAGAADQNESTPKDQRVPDRTTEVSAGPSVGEKGEYLPARYPTHPRTVSTPTGPITTPGNIREDR